ncbi:MAG: hypothetical protein A2Z20_03335 [Bdellovibrionales bacterium RBG_16_40_8]|nr:MAG: hypothetical protein A2Z20_03335 [Bdellovibrionales bacterium RBG_16_40_8]
MTPIKIATHQTEIKKEAGIFERDYSGLISERKYDTDVLSQFRANLQQVEDLNSRLRFMVSEVSGLIKRT